MGGTRLRWAGGCPARGAGSGAGRGGGRTPPPGARRPHDRAGGGAGPGSHRLQMRLPRSGAAAAPAAPPAWPRRAGSWRCCSSGSPWPPRVSAGTRGLRAVPGTSPPFPDSPLPPVRHRPVPGLAAGRMEGTVPGVTVGQGGLSGAGGSGTPCPCRPGAATAGLGRTKLFSWCQQTSPCPSGQASRTTAGRGPESRRCHRLPGHDPPGAAGDSPGHRRGAGSGSDGPARLPTAGLGPLRRVPSQSRLSMALPHVCWVWDWGCWDRCWHQSISAGRPGEWSGAGGEPAAGRGHCPGRGGEGLGGACLLLAGTGAQEGGFGEGWGPKPEAGPLGGPR